MVLTDRQLYNFLRDSDLVDATALEAAYEVARKNATSLADLLLSRRLIAPDTLQRVRATILGIPYMDLTGQKIDRDVLLMIPETVARTHKIVAFARTPSELRVAMLDPENVQMIDFVRKKTGLRIVPCLTSRAAIDDVLRQYTKSLAAEFSSLISKDVAAMRDQEDLAKVAEDLPVVRIVATLLKHAVLQGASDIHIEPAEKNVIVRYRVDGLLRDAMTLPKVALRGIVARVKVLANLKLDEHRLPQDGRFKIEQDGKKIALRVSILPVFDGEKIVMRLLDESAHDLTLEAIGLTGRDLDVVAQNITRPNGMILVTGPTGSGKTTTLYTVLAMLNQPTVNISTVEDPVEYRMPRINQTQVNAKIGMTFAAALRALLRQDPDIIMVGEIRDEETLEVALHAAMTGHLVLSTLHTNSAAGAIPRMVDMGAEAFLIASTLNIVIAQRLVRRLCTHCRTASRLREEEHAALARAVDLEDVIARLKAHERVPRDVTAQKITVYRAKGCDRCGGSGYRGRVGIFEVLAMSQAVEDATLRAATADAIAAAAREHDGMTFMIEDGIAKAVQGITTIAEVLRVTKE